MFESDDEIRELDDLFARTFAGRTLTSSRSSRKGDV